MKNDLFTEDEDLKIAKTFLDNMLAPLNKEERKELLKRLLADTEKI